VPNAPTCTVSVFTRGVPFGASPFQHTYIEITETNTGPGSLDIVPFASILEGGPSSKPFLFFFGGWGTLTPRVSNPWDPGSNPPPLGGTSPSTNKELGSFMGEDVCDLVHRLLQAIDDYNHSQQVAYAPVPNGSTTFNSNSFTYTLLSDIGLGGYFSSLVNSFLDPGWGQTVPGLH
jgi:hypothetical protein